MTRIGVVGEALVDVVRRSGPGISTRPGGAPFNVAIGLSRLGLSTTLATQLGTDADGDLLRATLAGSGVRLLELEPPPARTARAIATVDPAGIAHYEFEVAWDPRQLPPADAFDLVHIGSLGTVQRPGADVVVTWAREVASTGTPVSFDPNVRLGVVPDAAEHRRRFADIADFASIIKLSDDDAQVLFPGQDPLATVATLSAHTTLAAITLGGRGAVLASAGSLVSMPAPGVDVVDTIGAGDAFTAALLAEACARRLTRHASNDDAQLHEVLRAATTAAAINCARDGADPPTRAELEAALSAGPR